jgi:hypothetical protein
MGSTEKIWTNFCTCLTPALGSLTHWAPLPSELRTSITCGLRKICGRIRSGRVTLLLTKEATFGGMMIRSAGERSVVARIEWTMPVNRPSSTSTMVPDNARAITAAR